MLILQFFIRERLIVCNLDERVRSVPVGKAAFCESIDRKLDDLAFFRLLESGSVSLPDKLHVAETYVRQFGNHGPMRLAHIAPSDIA